MSFDIHKIYSEKLESYKTEANHLSKVMRLISTMRLIVFLSSFIIIYLLASANLTFWVITASILLVSIFLFLVKLHGKKDKKRELANAFIKINQMELESLERKYDNFESGSAYINPQHKFTSDLDVFGDGSLFQYINRTGTSIGRNMLAQKFISPDLDEKTIIKNQNAIKELSSRIDWRQNYQAIGITAKAKEEDKDRILSWSKEEPFFQKAIFGILVVLIPLITALLIVLLSLDHIGSQLFIMYLLIPLGISGAFSSRINKQHNKVSRTAKMLNKYADLIYSIEEIEFKSEYLQKLKKLVSDNNISAGKSINQLANVLGALDSRLNMIAWFVLNGLLLWDILQIRKLEKWKLKFKDLLPAWFWVIAEFDSLNSFAAFAYNNADSVSFPIVSQQQFVLNAENLGHPLIDIRKRVNNSVDIKENEFVIITGANMAGKSTYLRTIGTNLLLAMTGSPVCAKFFEFYPIQIFTSIHTVDSLKGGESYFFSELKRLKSIIDELKEGKELFIILDEILKGTNSKDKHAGSEALIKQFISLKTSGIVATHDVSLGVLQTFFPDHLKNRCFEVEIEGDQLKFDYKIHEGVSKNLNATVLMRKMGITV
jgi:Ca2+/Na+ antiporter